MVVEIKFARAGIPVMTLPDRVTPLDVLVDRWTTDRRPAWETVDQFEQDVERIMAGDMRPLFPPRDPTLIELG